MYNLSIIVPVYNVESYLQECIDSISSQINDFCEIILVDDGSTDNSGFLCDAIKEKDNNIVVIHKENGGLASARNTGLELARGGYVVFIDSDDRIAADCIKNILEWIDLGGADVCFMQAVKFWEDGTKYDLGDCISREFIKGKSKQEVLKYISTRPKFPGSSCTKIYRKSFLNEHGLRFPLENIQSEDLGFVRDCIMKANSFDCLDIPYYEYRQNRLGSITNTVSRRGIDGLLIFIEDTINGYSINKEPIEPYGKYALSFAAYEYGVLMLNCVNQSIYGDDTLKKINMYKWVLNYSVSNKQKVVKMIVKLFGVKVGSKIIQTLYKIRKIKIYELE